MVGSLNLNVTAFLLADSGYDIWLVNVRGNYYSQEHTKLSTNQSEYWNFRMEAFLLADSGYDIWLANVRGNYYSQKHTKLSTNQSEYWNFSYHEMGLYDLSATINYILSVTGEKRLFYIGVSMGTTIFYVLTSSRPEYNSKIRAMFSLAPAAYFGTLRSPLFKFVKSRTSIFLKILSMFGSHGLLPRRRLTADIAEKYCGDGAQTQDQCTRLFALVTGEPLDKINKTAIPFYINHLISGTSEKTLAHYFQNIASEEFQLYDYKYGGNVRNYGMTKPPKYNLRLYDYKYGGNVMNYGMTKPPKYNLSLITAPVALHYSQDDQLVHPNGVKKLQEQLPNCIGMLILREYPVNSEELEDYRIERNYD
uniref:AB hydrolase-1 domain-containing protein n=1 Tax=Timema shepardi TaxID=629360 RepID=A0A7R9B5I3_TIMSH|nr:unnamed protein product [Timema shepardi]